MTRQEHLRQAAARGTQKAGRVESGHQHAAVAHVLKQTFVEHFDTAHLQRLRGTAMGPLIPGDAPLGETLLAHQGFTENQASDSRHPPSTFKT